MMAKFQAAMRKQKNKKTHEKVHHCVTVFYTIYSLS